MPDESIKIETSKKSETHKAPQDTESPEKMIGDAKKEVASLQTTVAEDISKLVIDSDEKKALANLGTEAGVVQAEFLAEITPQSQKSNIIEITKDKNFEGSVIIKIQNTEGKVVGYALRKKSNGDLEGNEIGYMENGSVGWVQQIHESGFNNLRENGVMDAFEKGELRERDVKFARTEIQEVAELENLESRAGDFFETLEGVDISVENAEKYENDYVIPAYQKARKLKGIIESNNSERIGNDLEKEKPFNAISSIIKDKDALCIHFLTGFSNANNKTSASGIESSSGDTFSKRSREALKQLSTLAGLGPSISTSVFADSHNFQNTWYRNSGQPIGVILRDGECTEISSADASSQSASPKHRSGYGEIVTIDGLNKILSPEDSSFSKSVF